VRKERDPSHRCRSSQSWGQPRDDADIDSSVFRGASARQSSHSFPLLAMTQRPRSRRLSLGRACDSRRRRRHPTLPARCCAFRQCERWKQVGYSCRRANVRQTKRTTLKRPCQRRAEIGVVFADAPDRARHDVMNEQISFVRIVCALSRTLVQAFSLAQQSRNWRHYCALHAPSAAHAGGRKASRSVAEELKLA
jgi:hypothetical protein